MSIVKNRMVPLIRDGQHFKVRPPPPAPDIDPQTREPPRIHIKIVADTLPVACEPAEGDRSPKAESSEDERKGFRRTESNEEAHGHEKSASDFVNYLRCQLETVAFMAFFNY